MMSCVSWKSVIERGSRALCGPSLRSVFLLALALQGTWLSTVVLSMEARLQYLTYLHTFNHGFQQGVYYNQMVTSAATVLTGALIFIAFTGVVVIFK